MTLLELSRATGIERTRLYRFIDQWVDQGIVEQQLAYKTKVFRAVGVDRIKLLITQKKAALDGLAASFNTFAQEIAMLENSQRGTSVLYYRGRLGMRQMIWNTMRAKEELLSYVSRNWQEVVGQTFFNQWVGEFRTRNIPNRELRHPDFIQTVDTARLQYQDLGPTYRWRNLSPAIMNITHGMDIYNDVVAVSYWQGDDVFGIEIMNPVIARMQRDVFNHFWRLAGKEPVSGSKRRK